MLGKAAPDALHVVQPRHQALWDKCVAVLRKMGIREDDAELGFSCTSIGITKNFRGSPHVDSKDATFQYAASLGRFDHSTGGQLCVESGGAGSEIVAIDTFQKIARLDGRFIHFVKDFSGDERYSIIWFCVDEEKRKDPERAVYDRII